jgi:hypothetical protein
VTSLDDACPRRDLHTPTDMAESYGDRDRATWREEMLRTHQQIRCPGCGLFVIWKLRRDAPKLPSIEYRLVHRYCDCCDGDPRCDCDFHPEVTPAQSGLRRALTRIRAAIAAATPEETDPS